MYRHILMERGQIFEEGVTLPQTSPHTCAAGLNAGNKLGMLACTVTARTVVDIAAGKTVAVTFQDSADNGVYGDHSTHSFTAAAAMRVSPGGVVARFVLPPDTRPWIKARVAIDGSGSVDIFAEYLAR